MTFEHPQDRARLFEIWRGWVFGKRRNHDEIQNLRSVIAAAHLRLARLDDSNADVSHARKILESAVTGAAHTWP